jgi:hypothetical protein
MDPSNVVDPDPVDPKLSVLLDPDPDIDPSFLIRFEEISENKFRIFLILYDTLVPVGNIFFSVATQMSRKGPDP